MAWVSYSSTRMTAAEPFAIEVADGVLDDLRRRLDAVALAIHHGWPGSIVGGRGSSAPDRRVGVLTAYARFPGDGICPPCPWVEYWYNIVRWTEMPHGGHFASLEAPELYVEDVVDYFIGLG